MVLLVLFSQHRWNQATSHLYHHLQKPQLSFPWSHGFFASQTKTPSGSWLSSGTLPFTMVVSWQCPLTCMSYLLPKLVPGDKGEVTKPSSPSINHGNQQAGEVKTVSGPWSHPLVTKPCLPDCSCCLWAGSKDPPIVPDGN